MPRKPSADSRSPSSPSSSDAKRAPTLASLRGEIDRIDKELVQLINRRAEISLKVGQVKHKQGIEIWSAAREDEVIAKALAASKGPIPADALRVIYR